ncbi:MAG: hypothetical protein DHS20C18_24700 [Saprospiraceae bacterium]|nr:MAG: hypothetical protein DHS20C18_24700 [Saprospiraceae bacterium]
MKKLNIFWLLIDSARNFETDEDKRGLPKSVVNFAESATYFKNVVTSAPSTIQSISSMMTSAPSYLLSRSYNNYRGISDSFDYFPHMLKKNGYQIYGAIYFKHGRETMSDVFGMMDNKFYPKDLSHRKEVWTNNDIYNLFNQVLEKNDWEKPTMCYLHYNVRVDVNISEVIQNTLDSIAARGLMDNSVIIINSDHGYPTKARGWDPIAAQKEGWGHDKQLYNDNILTPLVIKYPGCDAKEVNDYIATIDIVPSLCHLLDLPPSPKFHGVNVFDPEIALNERLLRTDNRYVGQLPAFTSFIKGNKKCIIYKDSSNNATSEYFDLVKDPEEKNSLTFSKQFEELKNSVEENFIEFDNFHRDLLLEKWGKLKQFPNVIKSSTACVVLESTPAFKKIVESVFSELLPKTEIKFSEEVLENEKSSRSFDVGFVIIESEIPWDLNSPKKVAANFKNKELIYLDNNGKIYSNFIKPRLYFNFVKKRSKLFKIDKLFIFDLFYRMITRKLLKPVN